MLSIHNFHQLHVISSGQSGGCKVALLAASLVMALRGDVHAEPLYLDEVQWPHCVILTCRHTLSNHARSAACLHLLMADSEQKFGFEVAGVGSQLAHQLQLTGQHVYITHSHRKSTWPKQSQCLLSSSR
jgi:hypothetical protein